MPRKSQAGPFFHQIGGLTREELLRFFTQQMELFGPALTAMQQAATIQGNRLQTQLSGALGRAGVGGTTAVGATLRGIGGTIATQQVAQQRIVAMMKAIENATGLAAGVGQQFVGIRQAELQAGQGQSSAGKILGGLGALVGAGADIFTSLGGKNLGNPTEEPDVTGV